MATFVPYFAYQKLDGTSRVMIRIHHANKRKVVSTEIFVTPQDLTKKGKIKNPGLEIEIQKILQEFRQKIQQLGMKAAKMTVDEIHRHLIMTTGDEIDFIKYAQSIADDFKANGRVGMARNYNAAIRSMIAFARKDSININELTSQFFTDYAKHMKTAKSRSHTVNSKPVGTRAVSLYTGIFRAILNRAKAQFNDEESEVINIRVNPFKKFKIQIQEPTSYRSITKDQIVAIRDFDLENANKRVILARDCFMLSFYMAGINSVDLYNAPKIEEGRLTYNRTKTSTRRKDQAEISIKIEPEAKKIIEKYSKNDLLLFKTMYSSADNFNRAINKGLKEIGKEIGLPALSFYAARHSWATIASNDCHIDKYTVHLALNHVDQEMKITDRYIRKDWSMIDKANRKVLDFLC
jgi:integrase